MVIAFNVALSLYYVKDTQVIAWVKEFPNCYSRIANGTTILVIPEVTIERLLDLIQEYALACTNKIMIMNRFSREHSRKHEFPHEDIFIYQQRV